jgi:hypothetical protein
MVQENGIKAFKLEDRKMQMMREMKLVRSKAAGVIAVILVLGVPRAPACT